ncbi:MFS transporter [Candidatus Bathyarchaeota archaeon]|nr:MAG: MFS transporter [Candidatus Bathyarchaeota archaeon]
MESTKRWLVLASVLSSRVVYTINWFNISPALPIIQSDLKIDQASIGLLTSSFLLGAGLFQIPAGVLSSRWGPKNTSQLGMLTLSLSAIGEGVSPNFPILFTSRFLLGIGAALFFAPAIGVLTPLFKHDEEGFVMGLYSAMFNVGGGLGLFAWAFLVEVWNWHVALVLGGIIGLVLVMFGQVVIPKDVQVLHQPGSMGVALRSRNIMLISFGIIGIWGGIFTTSQFLPKFLGEVYQVPTGQAGLIASLIMFAAILGGPVGGRASDLLRQRKVFMLIPGFAVALGLALIGIAPPDQMWLLIPIIGFMDAIVFSIEYASASQFPEVGQKYASLAISFMNSAQILGSFGVPIVFAILGYPLGWYFLGGVAAATLLLVFWIQEPFKANGQGLG